MGGDPPPERPGDRAGQQDRAVPPRLESVAGNSYFRINSLLLLFLWNATLTTHTLLFGRYHDVLECFIPITFYPTNGNYSALFRIRATAVFGHRPNKISGMDHILRGTTKVTFYTNLTKIAVGQIVCRTKAKRREYCDMLSTALWFRVKITLINVLIHSTVTSCREASF